MSTALEYKCFQMVIPTNIEENVVSVLETATSPSSETPEPTPIIISDPIVVEATGDQKNTPVSHLPDRDNGVTGDLDVRTGGSHGDGTWDAVSI